MDSRFKPHAAELGSVPVWCQLVLRQFLTQQLPLPNMRHTSFTDDPLESLITSASPHRQDAISPALPSPLLQASFGVAFYRGRLGHAPGVTALGIFFVGQYADAIFIDHETTKVGGCRHDDIADSC